MSAKCGEQRSLCCFVSVGTSLFYFNRNDWFWMSHFLPIPRGTFFQTEILHKVQRYLRKQRNQLMTSITHESKRKPQIPKVPLLSLNIKHQTSFVSAAYRRDASKLCLYVGAKPTGILEGESKTSSENLHEIKRSNKIPPLFS